MEAPRPHRPPSIRLINALGRAASGLGLRLPSLSEESLLRAAERATGLTDFGPDGFRPGLHQLLASLERDAALTSIGRMFARGQIAGLLASRLRLVEHRKQHPDLANERVERPLFVLRACPSRSSAGSSTATRSWTPARDRRRTEHGCRRPLAGPSRRGENGGRDPPRRGRAVACAAAPRRAMMSKGRRSP